MSDSSRGSTHVEAQNRVTFGYLHQLPTRAKIRQRITELWDYEKYGMPFKRGGRYFFSLNDGLQNQSVLYWMESVDAEPKILLDPNQLSEDGTVALMSYSVSEDGKLLAYGLSASGSDWMEWKVREVDTGQDRSDHIPVITDDQILNPREIIIGDSERLQQLGMSIDFHKLSDDGYAICTSGEYLVMVGGSDQGTLYAVYSFLEKYLGCRWYSSKVSHIPRQSEITIGQIDETKKPALKFREVYYADAMDPVFATRQKLNGNASTVQNGKQVREKHRDWGTWCHTFYTFVPPDKYFAEHPEYFSLINGKREPVSQLCVTNPDVFRITLAELRRRIKENPEDRYWDVSQNDRHSNCTCPNCKAVDDREGTPMGSVLEFVNKIATEFPEKNISTLSYQYTRRPPAKIRPAKNVSIMLCSIECNRSEPIFTDPLSVSFRSDVQDWSKICDRVFIWDYVVQFSNLVSPFPNLRVLQPNVQFFVANNAQGMFAQGNREVHGEFAHLRAYLLAKLLWGPDCDVGKIMDDFLSGYYGAAGPMIRKYIDLMHDELEKSGKPLNIFGGPKDHGDGYLSEKLIARYDKIFDDAEQCVASMPQVLLRVQEARMPLMYAKLELEIGDLVERKKVAKRLFNIADSVGLLAFNEWNLPIEKYRADVMSRF